MQVMMNLVLVLQLIAALAMIGLVLVQHGKGADMGASFGSGASGSLFGATGSANFLSRSTAVAATIFFVATLALAYMGSHRDGSGFNTGPSAGEQLLERAATPASPASAAALPGASIAPQAAPSAAASGASN
ncbi:preprotein translocase subunit SecG [Mitsuaria sp. GD03876]|uniref:preprotein translocase subunit SecG n=1 Tax=Mitsuaria sp. GD03876 TaxID=2975399 RepID=UPI0024484BD3|nr:preprotein translocase subunit SecG [Mitsuaria sp. GD03876]MDH0866522.1 preprotein translocase subunit SecG [Mitsuaria sp. GD03876]